ncbi:MAG: 6-hydroxymethylpterin diphosphokinase MptE-like protein, partial [Atribacterota bacterium]
MKIIHDLKDIYKDRIAFIIGAGPSLHFQDINPLKNTITIAVNAGIVKADFASYFLTDDIDVTRWSYYAIDLPKLDCNCLFYRDKIKGNANHVSEDRIYWYDHLQWGNGDTRSLNFSKDGPLVGARTSVGTAVHAAHIMGCNPIVLLGCDCCYHENKRYFWQFDGGKSPYRLDRKPVFCQAHKKKKGKQIDHHSESFLEYWDHFSEKAKKFGLNIINASGGILESFE